MMSEQHAREVSTEPQHSLTLSEHVRQAAMLDCMPHSLQAARQAIATVDNSAAAKAMFPSDEVKKNAAYLVMMHDRHFAGYPTSEAAEKLLSPKELQQVEEYAAHYKQSLSARTVKAEALKLQTLGFPKVQLHESAPCDS
jgi:hypothetical protein